MADESKEAFDLDFEVEGQIENKEMYPGDRENLLGDGMWSPDAGIHGNQARDEEKQKQKSLGISGSMMKTKPVMRRHVMGEPPSFRGQGQGQTQKEAAKKIAGFRGSTRAPIGRELRKLFQSQRAPNQGKLDDQLIIGKAPQEVTANQVPQNQNMQKAKTKQRPYMGKRDQLGHTYEESARPDPQMKIGGHRNARHFGEIGKEKVKRFGQVDLDLGKSELALGGAAPLALQGFTAPAVFVERRTPSDKLRHTHNKTPTSGALTHVSQDSHSHKEKSATGHQEMSFADTQGHQSNMSFHPPSPAGFSIPSPGGALNLAFSIDQGEMLERPVSGDKEEKELNEEETQSTRSISAPIPTLTYENGEEQFVNMSLSEEPIGIVGYPADDDRNSTVSMGTESELDDQITVHSRPGAVRYHTW